MNLKVACALLIALWSVGACGPKAPPGTALPGAAGQAGGQTVGQPFGPRFDFPLRDATPGEWIVLKGGDLDIDYRIRSATPVHVEVDIRRVEGGVPQIGRDTREIWERNLWGLPLEGVIRNLSLETAVIGDSSLPAWKVTLANENGRRMYWINAAFPANGVVQVARVIKGREEEELGFKVSRDSLGALGAAAASPLAGERAVFVPPLSDAEDGEVLVLGARSLQIQYRVVESERYLVRVDVSKRTSLDAPWGAPVRQEWHRNGFGVDPSWVLQSLQQERISIAGFERDTWRLTVKKGEERRVYWLDGDVPANGVLRVAPLRADGTPDLNGVLDAAVVR